MGFVFFRKKDLCGKVFKDKKDYKLHSKRVKDKRDKDLDEKYYES